MINGEEYLFSGTNTIIVSYIISSCVSTVAICVITYCVSNGNSAWILFCIIAIFLCSLNKSSIDSACFFCLIQDICFFLWHLQLQKPRILNFRNLVSQRGHVFHLTNLENWMLQCWMSAKFAFVQCSMSAKFAFGLCWMSPKFAFSQFSKAV